MIRRNFVKENKLELLSSLVVFFVSFGVYLKTLCPTIYFGDSGDLIASVYTLGIPHPTGYPLYCLLGKLFTYLPFGDIAYRVNLMSAFFGSATAVLLYFIMVNLKLKNPVALATALLFAFSSTFWSQAVIAEVYTLNVFFTAAIILILLIWLGNRNDKYLYLLSFVYGLSLTHHRSMVLMVPAMLFLVLSADLKILFDWRRLLLMVGCFVLGLSVYLYLPLRMLARPVMNWQNISSWRGLWFHIKGVQYSFFLFNFSWQELWHNFLSYLAGLLGQFTVYLLPFALVGLLFIFNKSKRILTFLLLAALFNILFVINYGVPDVEVFRLPSFFVVAIFVGLGTELVTSRYLRSKYIMMFFVLTLPLIVFLSNYRENDRSQYCFAYDYGMNILKSMEPKAIFIPTGDNEVFITSYLKVVEGVRPDISLYEEFGNISLPSTFEAKAVKKITKSEIAAKYFLNPKHNVYFTRYQNLEFFPKLKLVPEGLLYKLKRDGKKTEELKDYWDNYEMRGWLDPKIYKDKSAKMALFNYYTKLYVTRDVREVGEALKLGMEEIAGGLENAQLFLAEQFLEEGSLAQAKQKFEKALEIIPSFSAAHIGLARIALREKKYQQAIFHCNDAIRFFPLESEAYLVRGEAYEKLGKFDQAEKNYLLAWRRAPYNFSPRMKLGKLYLAQGENKKAADHFEAILKINPKHPEARKLLKKAQVSSAH